jgi:hypothetical protein
MPNAGQPSGPTQPTQVEREDANEREQVAEALGGPELAHGHHAGKVGRHNPPSPKVGTADEPVGDGGDGGDAEGVGVERPPS